MGIIRNIENDKLTELEYDDTLWEVIDIPEDVQKRWYEREIAEGKPILTKTLHYIGPVIDGKIECEVPTMNLQYHTFAGCRGLKDIPTGFKPTRYWEPFYDCKDLNPSASVVKEYWRWHRIYGGYYGSLLLNCGSKVVLRQDSQEAFLGQITGHSLPEWTELTDWSGRRYDEWKIVRFPVTDLRKIYQILIEKQLPIKEGFWVTGNYGTMEVTLIDKASELPSTEKLVVTKNFVVCCNHSGAVYVHDECTIFVGFFSLKFENDTLDEEILSVRPQVLHGNLSAIKAEEAVEFDGDCVMESDEGPAIECTGIVTLKGTGNVVLRGHGMHPAIGVSTHTGMSYGRWCPGDSMQCALKKIIIDGVRVRLESDVPNFTVGSYGRGEVPEIECVNGGTIDCPEVRGDRVMVQSGAEGLCGSTKRSEPAIYELREKSNSQAKRKTNNMNFF